MYDININNILYYFPDIDYNEDDAPSIEEYMQDLIDIVDKAINQEFLRLRTAGLYNTGDLKRTSNEMCFRIGSIYYNWFDIIWEIAYENKDRFDTITIATDTQAGREFRFYNHNGNIMNGFPVKDFITLKGNPIFESLSHKEYFLQAGCSIFESFPSNTHWLNKTLEYESEKYLKESIWAN